MQHTKSLFTAFLLVLTLVAMPALAGDAAPQAEVTPSVEALTPETPEVALEELFVQEPVATSLLGGGNCNQAVCGPGQYCCNFSCSTCVNFGDYCTQQICPQYE